MTASRARLVLLVWLLALLVSVVAVWTAVTVPGAGTNWEEIVLFVGLPLGFTTIGAILVLRRPAEPVGRIALLLGVVAIAAIGLRSIAMVLDGQPGPIPTVGALVATIESLLWYPVMLGGGMLLVRFPAGREPGRLSTVADALFVAGLVCATALLVAPGEIHSTAIQAAANPLGFDGIGRGTFQAVGNLVLFCYLAGLATTAAVLARRYRWSGPVVRAQLRWVAAAGLLPVVLFPGLFLGPAWFWSLWLLSFSLLPIAIGVAILRYRLYDIDRIVSRTLAYALVTAVLAGVFISTNLGLQSFVVASTGRDTIGVAVSTLVVAALFLPIRRRVQAPIDRRFNRAHLDAERVVSSFAQRTRDEVDLARLRKAMVGVAFDAMTPAGAGVWLRGEQPLPVAVGDAGGPAR